MRKVLLVVPSLLLFMALAGWSAFRLYQKSTPAAPATSSIPATTVKRGDVAFTITAKGELQGGNSETLFAPMVGSSALVITSLRESGELVKEGDTVAEFDTTEQEFKLKEAEADLAEAEQQVAQAQAESQAKEEEARSALVQARAELRVAELETRRNELV